jgi:hypothetical protein
MPIVTAIAKQFGKHVIYRMISVLIIPNNENIFPAALPNDEVCLMGEVKKLQYLDGFLGMCLSLNCTTRSFLPS